MCARIVVRSGTRKPGDRVPVKSRDRSGRAKWVGFARSETAQAVWGETFNVELDIPAGRFAESNRNTGRLVWDNVPNGHVISGVGNRATGEVRILTREANAAEQTQYGHHRLPVIIPRRF